MTRQALGWALGYVCWVGCQGQLAAGSEASQGVDHGHAHTPDGQDDGSDDTGGDGEQDGPVGDGDANQPPASGDGDEVVGDGDGAATGDGDAPAGDGDVLPGPDAGTDEGTDDPAFPGPLSECPDDPSIDRLESWLASGEGSTVPTTGSILEGDGDEVVARIEFKNAEWHVVPVLTANRFDGGEADFSSSRGFWLTYSASDALYVQLRPSFAWDGGAKWLTAIPSTEGKLETHFFSFAPEGWTTLDALGTPPYDYPAALAAVRGFVFVGETPNTITFAGLRVDGYEPPCL
jgi:hypothetical protein